MMREDEIKDFLSNLNDNKVKKRAPVIKKIQFQPFKENKGAAFVKTSMSHLEDVTVDVEAVLGNSEIKVEGFLNITEGSLIRLDTPIGENATVYINEQRFAKGEIIVINDSFAVRITEINHLPNLRKLEEI